MNRRNFILGLGTAATLSGAASVTGASIQNAVEPSANFNVVATEELEVQKNSELSDSTMANNGNYSQFLNPDFPSNTTANFNPNVSDDNGQQFPNMTIDNGTNGELDMALATNNTNDTKAPFNRNGTSGFPSGTPYDDQTDGAGISPLEIVNPGSSQDVSVEYIVGDDVDNSQSDQLDIVTQVFRFYINGNLVSPSPADEGGSRTTGDDTISNTSDNTASVSGTTDVDFRLAYNDEIASELANLADDVSDIQFTGSQTDVNLLDTVRFGVDT